MIACALRQRGISCLFAARDLGVAETLFANDDFELVQAPFFCIPEDETSILASYSDILRVNGFGSPELLSRLADAWLDLFRRFAPDVIMIEYSPTALLAAKVAKIPVIRIDTGFGSPPPEFPFHGENLFVGPSGEWLADYIPAYIRRYPFISTEGEDAARIVCIDEAFDGLNREEGQPLFEGTAPGPYLQKALEFLNDFLVQMKVTEMFCQQLQELGLLKSMKASIQLVDSRTFTLTDFLVVDEQKLQKINGENVEKLFRSGNLTLVYAHILSLKCIRACWTGKPPEKPRGPYTESSDCQ